MAQDWQKEICMVCLDVIDCSNTHCCLFSIKKNFTARNGYMHIECFWKSFPKDMLEYKSELCCICVQHIKTIMPHSENYTLILFKSTLNYKSETHYYFCEECFKDCGGIDFIDSIDSNKISKACIDNHLSFYRDGKKK